MSKIQKRVIDTSSDDEENEVTPKANESKKTTEKQLFSESSASEISTNEDRDIGDVHEDTDEENDKSNSDGDNKDPTEMSELFGSDLESDEEEFKASGIKEETIHVPLFDQMPSTVIQARSVGETMTLKLPKVKKAPSTTSYFVTKMPNILRVRPTQTTTDSIQKESLEVNSESDLSLYSNYIRWRYLKNEKGEIKKGDDGRLLRETNTKLVEWENGTFTLFVGKEAFHVKRQPVTNSFIFIEEVSRSENQSDETILECQAPLYEKLTIRPVTGANKSHKAFAKSLRIRHNKGTRTLKEFISGADPDTDKQRREKLVEDQLRQEAKKKARMDHDSDRRMLTSEMDEHFLEEGYDDIDYDDDDLSAIKERFTGRSKRKSAPKPHKSHKETFHGGYDEYEDQKRYSQDKDSADEGSISNDESDDDELGLSTKKRRTIVDE